jgi:hypothetical protein
MEASEEDKIPQSEILGQVKSGGNTSVLLMLPTFTR